ncbi:MAG: phage baseplate assembly protein V [Actinomycetota bacterium]
MSDSHSGPFQPPSKYIGETEPALRRVSNVSESGEGPALTLEESAALFGGRAGEGAGSADPADPTSYGGIYGGTCLNSVDPLLQGRLQVSVPAVPGVYGTWAQACLPPEWDEHLPAAGDGIWVMFEGGNDGYPVWIGVRAG